MYTSFGTPYLMIAIKLYEKSSGEMGGYQIDNWPVEVNELVKHAKSTILTLGYLYLYNFSERIL